MLSLVFFIITFTCRDLKKKKDYHLTLDEMLSCGSRDSGFRTSHHAGMKVTNLSLSFQESNWPVAFLARARASDMSSGAVYKPMVPYSFGNIFSQDIDTISGSYFSCQKKMTSHFLFEWNIGIFPAREILEKPSPLEYGILHMASAETKKYLQLLELPFVISKSKPPSFRFLFILLVLQACVIVSLHGEYINVMYINVCIIQRYKLLCENNTCL